MVFSGITFLLFYLPLFFLVYYSVPDKFKNTWLIIASLIFYSWGAPLFIFVVMLSCGLDYYLALHFNSSKGKFYFISAIVLNVAMLAYFKYANFFIDNFNHIALVLTGNTIPWVKVILPIGISFLTFQKISFLTDVYRKDVPPQKSYWNYLLFVILFPHLIAGPIVRYKEINAQITNRHKDITTHTVYTGLIRFVIGLSKKVLIANVLGEHANSIFNQPIQNIDFTMAWTGIIAYTFQIYFDFSGYSDMAIGVARMAGFTIPENFHFPYSSKSITEFWKRWHITLGNWMKDYIYIPLGGNKISINRTYINLFTVFLFSGLWHGASWNFVIWGAFHGLFLVIERIGLNKILERAGTFIPVLYTFIIVLTGWVFFRIENNSQALLYIQKLYSPSEINLAFINSLNPKLIVVLCIAMIFSFARPPMQFKLFSVYVSSDHPILITVAISLLVVFLYILNIGELFATGFNPFIYFKF